MRFYSFVANLYLSPLQHGLQTGHAISDMSVQPDDEVYREWAKDHKTIIICAAINAAGVVDAYHKAKFYGDQLGLPTVIFHEDQQSLAGSPTAAGIVVPAKFYDAKPFTEIKHRSFFKSLFGKELDKRVGFRHTDETGNVTTYADGSVEAEFIKFLKSYRLA